MSIKRENSPVPEIGARSFHNSANQVDETMDSVKTKPEPEEGPHHRDIRQEEIKQEPDIEQEPEPEPRQEQQPNPPELAPTTTGNVWIITDLDFSRRATDHVPATCQVVGVYRTLEDANGFAISFARFLNLDSIANQTGVQPHITVRNNGSVSVRVHDPVT